MLSIITLMAWLENRLRRDDKGEVAIEYVLVGGLAAVAIVAAMATFNTSVTGWFTGIATTISGALP